jgi:hypothetical protein
MPQLPHQGPAIAAIVGLQACHGDDFGGVWAWMGCLVIPSLTVFATESLFDKSSIIGLLFSIESSTEIGHCHVGGFSITEWDIAIIFPQEYIWIAPGSRGSSKGKHHGLT